MPQRISCGVAKRRILLALGASLVLHVVVLQSHGRLSLPGDAPSAGRLELRLRAPALPSVPPSLAPIARVAETELSAATTTPEIKPAAPRETARPKSRAGAAAKPSAATPAATTAVELPPTPTPTPAQASDKSDQASGIPLPGLSGAVKRVMIDFEMFSGADRQSLGSTRHVYVSDNSGHYGLSVKQLPLPDAAADHPPWQLDISGTITRQGLSPQIFSRSGSLPTGLMALRGGAEHSSAGLVKSQKGRVPDGLLDRQSLLYQFMLTPPELGGGQLWLTDGVVHGHYAYRLAGIESLTLPSLGGVRTIKVILSAEGSAELIELWLVPDAHYLPVKIRYTDRQGGVTEQLATSMDFDG